MSEPANPLGYSSAEIAQALMKAYMAGDAPAAAQLGQMYELAAQMEKEAAETPKFSSTAQGRIADTQKGLAGIDSLAQMINSGGYTGGVLQGNLRQFNPFDTEFKSQQAMVDTVRQFVGKALEGGVLRKEDEEKYRKILPTMQDDPEVANSKLAYLKEMIQNDLANYTSLASGGAPTIEAALSSY
jgi:hypothetical protein